METTRTEMNAKELEELLAPFNFGLSLRTGLHIIVLPHEYTRD